MKRPVNAKVIRAKWVTKVKRDQFHFIQKFKARLVVQGHSQIQDVDYSDSYSPVIKKTTVRLMTGIAVDKGWICKHLDVKCVYLNSEIEEIVYIEQPQQFIDQNKPDYVNSLKACMDLPQSGRNWNEFIDL